MRLAVWSQAVWFLALLPLALGAGPAEAAFPLESDSGTPSVAPVLHQVMPGVVNIAVKGREQVDNPLLRDPIFRRFFNVPNGPVTRETQAMGSGVIVDAQNGTVVTNNHVVEHADLIEVVLFDQRRFKAKLIGRDPQTDVAVLKIPAENLTALPFGDSDRSQVGDFVLAIGNPFGLGQTVTSGIVSALGRGGLGIEGYEDFIQTDAAINPGNSGGALVDLKGRLIGINTAILAPSGGNVGVGFAVPVNMVRTVMDQLLKHGHIERGWIGIGGQDVTPELARGLKSGINEGVLVAAVEPGAPAAAAGIQTGDVITAINGTPVHSWQQCINRIALSQVGDELSLSIDRQGQQLTTPVKVGPRPTRRIVRESMPQQEAPEGNDEP
ncbi:MAG TPA: Do family serine endopeptidase [Stellaceae bacterium]|nr:Do family serine endopeptidase [Stellaceae bacterium]